MLELTAIPLTSIGFRSLHGCTSVFAQLISLTTKNHSELHDALRPKRYGVQLNGINKRPWYYRFLIASVSEK